MKGPLAELADIVAAAAQHFTDRPPGWFTWMHLKVLVAIERCRTAAMGGHMDLSMANYQIPLNTVAWEVLLPSPGA